jgi:WD40 repeat protein
VKHTKPSNVKAVPASNEAANMSEEALSKKWRENSRQYVEAINAFVERGMTMGWDKVGEEPEDNRQAMANDVIDAVRRANQRGNLRDLRERFPPAYIPFVDLLEENGQSLEPIALLPDGRIVLRIGTPYEDGRVVVISDTSIVDVPGIITFGRSPDRLYFAVAKTTGVEILDGWQGPKVCDLAWPTGLEGAPDGYNVQPFEGVPTVTKLIPFPDGERVLLVSSGGIFVLTRERAVRVHPDAKSLKEHFDWLKTEYPDDPLEIHIDMEHGAVSPNGKLIAVGSQDSSHIVYNDKYEQVGDIGNLSEYPHYAIFSTDNEMIAFNSCHFYNGATVGVPTSLLPGLRTKAYELDKRLVHLEDGARVYAGVYRNDEFIIGDASGYLRAFDKSGKFRWQHFIGSSVGDIDTSADGKQLLVTTYAGFLCILDMDTGEKDPFAISTATHRERRRWLFWKKEPKPLMW